MNSEKTSRPKNIIVSDSVLMGIEKHAYSNLRAEVGGMLFGRVDEEGNTQIIGFIPALSAAAEQISLTFTHDVWADILSKGEIQFPGESIVGWYHTHPSFGLFMSDYDEFIQRNFFGKQGQIALVVDPIAGEMGWFSRSELDKINLNHREKTKMGPKPANPVETHLGKVSTVNILTHGAVAIISAAIVLGISFATRGPNLEESQRSLVESYSSLEAYMGRPNFIYTVKEGDSYESLSLFFYGGNSGEENLRIYNNYVHLEPGLIIFVPGPAIFSIAKINFVPVLSPPVSPSPSSSPAPPVSPSPSSSPQPSPPNTAIPSPTPTTSGGTTP